MFDVLSHIGSTYLRDLAVVALLALILTPLEHMLPAGRGATSTRRFTTDFLHMVLGGFLIRLGSLLAIGSIALTLAQLLPAALAEGVRAQPLWLQWAEVLVLSDLGFYAGHRLVHAVPALWRFHEVHHSSERLDWLASYRVHPVDQVLNNAIMAFPVLALGFSPLAVALYAAVYRVHALLLHSNLRIRLGWLERVIATPHFHHWHHADQPDAYDRNFGGQLVLFDHLFGTLNLPSQKPARYGVANPVAATFLGQLAHPFRPLSALAAAKTETA